MVARHNAYIYVVWGFRITFAVFYRYTRGSKWGRWIHNMLDSNHDIAPALGLWISKCIHNTQENHLFQPDLDGNCLVRMKNGNISHYSRVNKKPWCLLYAYSGKQSLSIQRAIKQSTHEGVLHKTFTWNVTPCVLGVEGEAHSDQLLWATKRGERRETGLGFVRVIHRDEIRTLGEEHGHTVSFMWSTVTELIT